jgi:hypothetical protein
MHHHLKPQLLHDVTLGPTEGKRNPCRIYLWADKRSLDHDRRLSIRKGYLINGEKLVILHGNGFHCVSLRGTLRSEPVTWDSASGQWRWVGSFHVLDTLRSPCMRSPNRRCDIVHGPSSDPGS